MVSKEKVHKLKLAINKKDLSKKWDLWSKNDILTMIFFDFQLKSFADPKPVELWESAVQIFPILFLQSNKEA